MAWVANPGKAEEYNPNLSRFWSGARATLKAIEGKWFDEVNWSSRIAWTNLYRIAPAAGGNPNNRLCLAQLSECVDLLCLEVDRFSPERILFNTGLDWFGWFEAPLGIQLRPANGEHVHGIGELDGGNRAIPVLVSGRSDSRKSGFRLEDWAAQVSSVIENT